MKNVVGRIHSVESFGTLDGPGIRYVLFFQGCPLRCIYCHNPDSWCAKSGQQISSQDVIRDILKYHSFIKSGGVTLSGGEPLMQHEFATAILEGCREHGLHSAIDTSGGVPLLLCKRAIELADLILLDIKAADDEMFKKITSRSIDNTLDMLAACEQMKKPVWIRHVLMTGYTMDDVQLHKLGELLSHYKCIEKVELLPFHKMGEYKWESMEQRYTLHDMQPPKTSEVEHARMLLRGYKLPV